MSLRVKIDKKSFVAHQRNWTNSFSKCFSYRKPSNKQDTCSKKLDLSSSLMLAFVSAFDTLTSWIPNFFTNSFLGIWMVCSVAIYCMNARCTRHICTALESTSIKITLFIFFFQKTVICLTRLLFSCLLNSKLNHRKPFYVQIQHVRSVFTSIHFWVETLKIICNLYIYQNIIFCLCLFQQALIFVYSLWCLFLEKC